MKPYVLIGDLLDSKAQTLVNTVNTVGVMGKGVALQFKKRFPEMFEDYVQRCQRKQVRLGEPYLFRQSSEPWIVNFPTKDHWRSVSSLIDIEKGLRFLLSRYQEWGITSIAFPPLGCGHGGLDWDVVGPTLYRYLAEFVIPVELYAPFDTPHEELQPTFLEQGEWLNEEGQLLEPHGLRRSPRARPQDQPKMEPSWVALVAVLERIQREPYHAPVGHTVMQKLAYFATASGLPTHLEFKRGSYGPFAEAGKALLAKLVNHGLVTQRQLGRMNALEVGPTFKDAVHAYRDQLDDWSAIVDRVSDLFLRIKTTDEAEVAATVHFAAGQLAEAGRAAVAEREVLDEVLRWKIRRRTPLNPTDVAAAIRGLGAMGWIDVAPSEDLPVDDETLLGV